jgi:hypothetical protein
MVVPGKVVARIGSIVYYADGSGRFMTDTAHRSYADLGFSDDPSTVTSTSSGPPILGIDRDGEYVYRLTVDDLPTLAAGDQLLVRREVYGAIPEWIGAFLIRVGTFTRRDKRPTVVNHVATVIWVLRAREVELLAEGAHPASPLMDEARREPEGPVVDYLICEALGKGGVQLRPLLESYGSPLEYSFAVTRHKLATQTHRSRIVTEELLLVGRSYGYLKVGAHAADYALTQIWNLAGGRGDVFAFRWLCRMERYPMCSWKSLHTYHRAGLRFSTAVAIGSPDDLYDEMRRKAGTIWDWVFVSDSIHDEVFGPGYGGHNE